MKAICIECGKLWDQWDPKDNGHIRIKVGPSGGSGKVCGPVVQENDKGYAMAIAKLS